MDCAYEERKIRGLQWCCSLPVYFVAESYEF